MDKFKALSVFVNVADRGGFAAAARHLNMSPQGVTRAIAALEDSIGTRLFIRTTRSVRLTESGERFLNDSRRILSDLEEAQEAAIGSHAAPRGELTITAPILFGCMHITPLLGPFMQQYPNVSLRTVFMDRVVNMMDEGIDLAIRIGPLPDSGLSAVRVGTVRRVVFAAPKYLDQYGCPEHPEDLKQHQLIQSVSIGGNREWTFNDTGQPLTLKTNPRLRMNTNDAVIQMVKDGWGISRLLSYQISPYILQGQLKVILPHYEKPPLPVHILHREGRLVSAKVRACVDYLVDHFRAHPDWQ